MRHWLGVLTISVQDIMYAEDETDHLSNLLGHFLLPGVCLTHLLTPMSGNNYMVTNGTRTETPRCPNFLRNTDDSCMTLVVGWSRSSLAS